MENCEYCKKSKVKQLVNEDGLCVFVDNDETPKANNMNYCPQCGKILEEAPECWEEAE